MRLFGAFLIGWLTIRLFRLHYRLEVIPYARKHGHSRAALRDAAIRAHLREFDRAWPEVNE